MKPKSKKVLTIAAVSAPLVLASYYLVSPYLAVKALKDGIIARDTERLNKIIDYPALQSDLKAQLGAMMLREMQNDPEMAANPFAGFATAFITPMVNSLVDTYVTPSGLKMIFDSSSARPSSSSSGPPDEDAKALVERGNEFKEALAKTSMGYENLDKFQLSAVGNDGKKIVLLLYRQGFAVWKLRSVILPQP